MDKVQNTIGYQYYTPSSEPFRIYMKIVASQVSAASCLTEMLLQESQFRS
jgi:hypothetical protein